MLARLVFAMGKARNVEGVEEEDEEEDGHFTRDTKTISFPLTSQRKIIILFG